MMNLTSLAKGKYAWFYRLNLYVILKKKAIIEKLRYCDKATKFEKNLPLFYIYSVTENLFQIFVAFSENLNFTYNQNKKDKLSNL